MSRVLSTNLPLIEVTKSCRLPNDGPNVDAGIYGVQEMETLVYLHFADGRSNQAAAGGFCRLTLEQFNELLLGDVRFVERQETPDAKRPADLPRD